MKGTFVFLGTGASTGVPVIGCTCAVCTSSSPHNRRLRTSGLIRLGNKTFVIDASPDFREQALKEKIDHLDGLLLTHTHFDHIAGIDDLRVYYFRQKKPVPCLLSHSCREIIKQRYSYLDKQLDFRVFQGENVALDFEGMRVQTMRYWQGDMAVSGFAIGDFAYISDIREYDETIFETLKGVRTLVLSALRKEESHAHFSIQEAIAFAKRTGAKHTFLTHLSHMIDHDAENLNLPQDIRMGYDGLKFEFTA